MFQQAQYYYPTKIVVNVIRTQITQICANWKENKTRPFRL